MLEGKCFKYEAIGAVGVLTLNNPKRLNIVSDVFLEELPTFQDEIEKDASIRGLLINSTGPHFSAGIDLGGLLEVTPAYMAATLPQKQRMYSRFESFGIPVVAAIQGRCIGSACELILGCDLRIAAEDAIFSLPETRFGVAPDMGGTAKLTKLVGAGRAKRILLTCEELSARDALEIGLVEYVVPTEELQDKAMSLMKKMAKFPPAGLQFAKQGINMAVDSSTEAALRFEMAQSVYCLGQKESKEAIAAFLEMMKNSKS